MCMRYSFKSTLYQSDGTLQTSMVVLTISEREFIATDNSDYSSWDIEGALSNDGNILTGIYSSEEDVRGTIFMQRTETGFAGTYTGILHDNSVYTGTYVWERI
jgi:hypothetical protein